MINLNNFFEKVFSFRIVRGVNVGLIFEEVHLKRFFNEFKVDCVFDVGANHGQYAMMLRKTIGYKGPIISFEPIPSAQDELRKLSKVDPNWYIEPIALDSVSQGKIFNVMESDEFSSLHLPSHKEVGLFQESNKVSQQISVQTQTLSFMYEKYSKLLGFKKPFLKMDTQGHDVEIARGSESTLKSFVGLQSELAVKKLYEGAVSYTESVEYYVSQGFELSAFVPNNSGHFPRLIEIDCIMINKSSLNNS